MAGRDFTTATTVERAVSRVAGHDPGKVRHIDTARFLPMIRTRRLVPVLMRLRTAGMGDVADRRLEHEADMEASNLSPPHSTCASWASAARIDADE